MARALERSADPGLAGEVLVAVPRNTVALRGLAVTASRLVVQQRFEEAQKDPAATEALFALAEATTEHPLRPVQRVEALSRGVWRRSTAELAREGRSMRRRLARRCSGSPTARRRSASISRRSTPMPRQSASCEGCSATTRRALEFGGR